MQDDAGIILVLPTKGHPEPAHLALRVTAADLDAWTPLAVWTANMNSYARQGARHSPRIEFVRAHHPAMVAVDPGVVAAHLGRLAVVHHDAWRRPSYRWPGPELPPELDGVELTSRGVDIHQNSVLPSSWLGGPPGVEGQHVRGSTLPLPLLRRLLEESGTGR